MIGGLVLALRVAPFPLATVLRGLDDAAAAAIAQASNPPPVTTIIGPRGADGDPGAAGPEADDPGDLTLLFNNKLI